MPCGPKLFMMLSINNAVGATNIFNAIFIIALLLSLRRKPAGEIALSVSITQSLKGLAILMVFFSHIGYFLVTDHRFLYPLTTMAGVGVNLFLFLSGYGLLVSTIKKEYSVWQFYWHRLLKVFIPFWIAVTAFFVMDALVLKLTYSWSYIGRSILGFFPRADLFHDLNSPLWYITLILFYYLIFPIVFWKKRPWVSAVIIYAISYLIIQRQPQLLNEVLHLYKVHLIAFPLGMLLGSLFYQGQLGSKIGQVAWIKSALGIIKNYRWADIMKKVGHYALLISLLAVIGYTAVNSGIGQSPEIEERTSIITMLAITALFVAMRVEFKLLYLFGIYSYEIYLLHWPIMYRYDIFFKFMPAWLAVIAYLFLFCGLGWIFSQISRRIAAKISS